MVHVFLDTETTSLRHDRRVWEVGLIVRDDDAVTLADHHWFVDANDLDLGNADLKSLNIGGYFNRHPQAHIDGDSLLDINSEAEVMQFVEELTRSATIIGAVPWFDTDVLGQRMRAHGVLPSWHYHLVDVETLAAGALHMPPPWHFDKILGEFGLSYDEPDRHTALGDARMVLALYDRVMGRG